MELVRIEDRFSVREFNGELIKEVRTSRTDRWVVIRLYWLDGGGYLVHRIGNSVYYHADPTSCRTARGEMPGDVATVADLPDEAMPCDRCRPPYPEDLADALQVRYEWPRHTVNRCATATDVISRLTRFRDPDTQQEQVKVSEPVRELLAKAAEMDPAFSAAAKPVEHIR